MSIGLQVRLNGTPIRGRIEGLDSFSVTYSRNESTGRTQKAFSNELTFYDDGFNLIFNQLVASPTGLTKYIKVQIWDECCNDFIYQDLIIKGSMVKYCTGDCFVEATMIRQDPDERIYDCFDRTPITTDLENPDGSVNINHWLVSPNSTIAIPLIPYCNETKPAAIYWLITSLGLGMILIITILNFLTLGSLKDFKDWFVSNVIGCGRKHPSAYLKDYINEAAIHCQCDQATPFISSFLTNFNSVYYHTALISAPVKPGLRNPPRYIVENRPRQTITEFLDMVASDFNSLWWVENGRVYMERKDFFLTAPVLYDAIVNQKTGNILKGACFTYNEGTVYSAQRFEATNDAIEDMGNLSLNVYGAYFDYIKIHNHPQGWEAWRGVLEKQQSYSPVRFRGERNPESSIDAHPFRSVFSILSPNSYNATNWYATFSKDEFANHKYYACDNTSPDNEKRPIYGQRLLFEHAIGNNVSYLQVQPNAPFVIKVNPLLPNLTPNNIYTDFHAIDDPINNPWRFWDYELEVKMDCQLIKQLTVNKSVRLQTPYGATVQAKINTIVANYGERIITITGEF